MAFILIFIAIAIVFWLVAYVGESDEIDEIIEPYRDEDVLELTPDMEVK